jgi:hypothetical protein
LHNSNVCCIIQSMENTQTERTKDGLSVELLAALVKCTIGGRGGARSGAGRRKKLAACNHCGGEFGVAELRTHKRTCQLEIARAERAKHGTVPMREVFAEEEDCQCR